MSKWKRTRAQYTRMALAMSGIQIDDRTAELIVIVTDKVKRHMGNYALSDAAESEDEVAKLYDITEQTTPPEPSEKTNPI